MTRSSVFRVFLTVALLLSCVRTSLAQTAGAPSSASDAQSIASKPQPIDDEAFVPAEPDFTLIGLPTALRVPEHKGAFRVTHRFLRPLNQGDFGDLLGDFFGLDDGAQIGLEFRYGLIPNGQVGIQRTSDKTIEFFTEYGLLRQGQHFPLEVAIIGT
ncbi:MAG TPA: DUF5777 family beta-barrel protein, partial [Vicinamibacterales bacterium]|nr:DUF5777 family beta-barrel protein [Vicinamibacterales bacterium]